MLGGGRLDPAQVDVRRLALPADDADDERRDPEHDESKPELLHVTPSWKRWMQGTSSPHELLVLEAVRLVRGGAQTRVTVGFVVLVIPLEPDHASVLLEGDHVRGDAVQEPAVVADHAYRAGEAQ